MVIDLNKVCLEFAKSCWHQKYTLFDIIIILFADCAKSPWCSENIWENKKWGKKTYYNFFKLTSAIFLQLLTLIFVYFEK